MGSAGWLANQPRAWVLNPCWVRIFQMALTLREVLETGRRPPVCGSGSMKPWMPCLSARFPVAMEVHSMGERMGRSVARFPITPLLTRSLSAGISPRSRSGLITFQSAASQPISRTFLARRSPILSRFNDKCRSHLHHYA